MTCGLSTVIVVYVSMAVFVYILGRARIKLENSDISRLIRLKSKDKDLS
jgi:hypothetical protein